MSVSPREFPGSGSRNAAATPASAAGGQSEIGLGKPHESPQQGSTYTVALKHLDALRQRQITLQAYVAASVYSMDLLSVCGRARSEAERAKRSIEQDQEMDWLDYWADLSVAFEEATESTGLLAETDVFADEVQGFAAALEEATREIGEGIAEVDAANPEERLRNWDQRIATLEDLIDRINVECRNEAMGQVRKLAKVLDQIFIRIETGRNIGPIEQRSTEATGLSGPRDRKEAVVETSRFPSEETAVPDRVEKEPDSANLTHDDQSAISSSARALLGPLIKGASNG